MKKVLSTILVLSLFILTGCSAATKDTIRTVETVKGKIEIPNEPKRVVIDYFVGDALALGVEPVGTTYVYKDSVFEEDLKDVPSINGTSFKSSSNTESLYTYVDRKSVV